MNKHYTTSTSSTSGKTFHNCIKRTLSEFALCKVSLPGGRKLGRPNKPVMLNSIQHLILLAFLFLSVNTFAQSQNPSDYNNKVKGNGFYENKGQIVDQNYQPNKAVKYLLCQPGMNIQLRHTGFSYDTYTESVTPSQPSPKGAGVSDVQGKFQTPPDITRHYHRVDIELVGCNPAAPMIAEDKSEAYFNYFTAGTPQGGVSNVHYYQKVTYKNIYPNIDLVFFLNPQGTKDTPAPLGEGREEVEYNFVVHSGGNPADIKLQYKGANKVSLVNNPEGTSKLMVNVQAGDFTENIPSSYLDSHSPGNGGTDTKQQVQVNYKAIGNDTYSFSVAKLPPLEGGEALIIDPTPCLSWGTYYGGTSDDGANAIVLDASGNPYVTGYTTSTAGIATAGAYKVTYGGASAYDIFIAEFSSTGTSLLWGTYYGGTGYEEGFGIALDASDNVYINGYSQSTTNISTPGAYHTLLVGTTNAVVAKFNSTGTSLLWGTYYGGGTEGSAGIALDASDNVYIVGSTSSTSGIATPGAWQTTKGATGSDAFIAKFNSTGTSLLWGTYYGGPLSEGGSGIVLDASNNVYITGYTISISAISTPGAWQTSFGGGSQDAFVAKFDPTGSTLLWGTYYGGSKVEQSYAIALDASNNVYIAGYTTSTNAIATAGAYQTTYGGGSTDAFAAMFNSTGSTLLWGSYYGGSGTEQSNGIKVDAGNNVYFTGTTTSSSGIATATAYQVAYGGGDDAFVAKLNSTGSSLLWGSYYGGSGFDGGSGIALNTNNDVYITGITNSTSGIASAGAYQTALSGGTQNDAFITGLGCTSMALGASSSQTNVTCNGVCNGTAIVTASGGTSPYTYSWSGGQTTSSVTGLCANTYTCTLSDAVAATVTVSVTITEPVVLSATVSSVPDTCISGDDGIATANPSGGTSPYTYSWSPSGQTSQTATNLSAGSYTVTVTDAHSCNVTASVNVVTAAPKLSISSVNVSCKGGSNGQATVTSYDCNGISNYLWTPSAQTSQTATNLSAGIYTVKVTDNLGKNTTASVTITEPTALTASAGSIINIKCNGGASGSASVTAGAGTPGYTYLWSNGQTSSNATGLSASTYTVTVTDNNGCTKTASATITQPSVLTITICSQTNVSCNGSSDGCAGICVAGGTPGYSYTWSNGATLTNACSLTAGSYTATVTDANGCSATTAVSITQPTALTISLGSISNISCKGGNNGKVTATPSGGTGAYTYTWDNGATTATISNLTAGCYTVTVKDNNGCTATASTCLTEPPTLVVSIGSVVNVSCFGSNNGSMKATPSGGTGGYTYTWAPGGQITPTITGLSAGCYTVTITDANTCTVTASTCITQPAQLRDSIITPVTNILCNGGNNGTMTVGVKGGTGTYTYAWTPTGGTNVTANNLSAGCYTVTVTDANGCTKSATACLTQPGALVATAFTNSNVLCNGGSDGGADAAATGGTPGYTYTWSNGQTGTNATGLSAATYTVTVTDANGCNQTASATITQPPALTVTICSQTNVNCNGGNDGCAGICIAGGTPGYTYIWSNGATLTNACGLTAGTYTATVTDAHGCIATASATITEPPILTNTATAVNTTLCAGSCTDIDVTGSGGTPAYSYSWSTGGTSTSINVCPVTTTVYTCTVTDANGCSNVDTAIVNVDPTPTILLGGNDSICQGSSTTISAVGGGSYLWSTGATTSAITVNPASNSTYTISVSNGTCTSDTTVSVIVNPLPTLSIVIAKDTPCVNWTTDALTGTPSGGTFSGTGVTGSNFNPTAAGTGTYMITYTYIDGNGCSNSDSIKVVVSACTGIDEVNALDNEVKFYPNPFSQSINVSINTKSPGTITMFNMMGQGVGSWQMDQGQHKINTQNYPSGVYMLQVKTTNGLMNKKLIKVN